MDHEARPEQSFCKHCALPKKEWRKDVPCKKNQLTIVFGPQRQNEVGIEYPLRVAIHTKLSVEQILRSFK